MLGSAIMTLQGQRPQVSLMGRMLGYSSVRPVGAYGKSPGHLLGLAGFLDPLTLHPMIFILGLAAGIWYAGKRKGR